MKFVVVFLLSLLAVQALSSNVALRLKAKIDAPNPLSADSLGSSSIMNSQSLVNSLSTSAPTPAPMSGSLSAALPSTGSLSGSMASMAAAPTSESSLPATPLQNPGSASSSSASTSGCQAQTACGNQGDSDLSVEDAVKPIDQWMKDFKARTSGEGGDLMAAAKSTVAPLLQKLKRNQETAVEKLQESNDAILRHVEEATTNHVYNLLRAEHIEEEKESSAEAKKAKVDEVKAALEAKKLEAKLLESSESSKKF